MSDASAVRPFQAAKQFDSECNRLALEYFPEWKSLRDAVIRIAGAMEDTLDNRAVSKQSWKQLTKQLLAFGESVRRAKLGEAIAALNGEGEMGVAIELAQLAVRNERAKLAALLAEIRSVQDDDRLPWLAQTFGITLCEKILELWRLKNQPQVVQQVKALAEKLNIDLAVHLSPESGRAKLSAAAWGMLRHSELNQLSHPKPMPIYTTKVLTGDKAGKKKHRGGRPKIAEAEAADRARAVTRWRDGDFPGGYAECARSLGYRADGRTHFTDKFVRLAVDAARPPRRPVGKTPRRNSSQAQ